MVSSEMWLGDGAVLVRWAEEQISPGQKAKAMFSRVLEC